MAVYTICNRCRLSVGTVVMPARYVLYMILNTDKNSYVKFSNVSPIQTFVT